MNTCIYQEFCERKNLNFPLVLYNKKYFALFKKNNECRVVSVNWRTNDSSPGYFDIDYFKLNSSIITNSSPDYILKSFNCSWENYEKEILILIKSIKEDKFIFINSKEINDYIWQMFISICEKYLIENCDYRIFEKIVFSLDKNISKKIRKKNILNILNYFSNNHVKIFNLWKYQLTPLVKQNDNDNWLKNLYLKI